MAVYSFVQKGVAGTLVGLLSTAAVASGGPVASLDWIGQATFPTGFVPGFAGASEVGGLSGIAYDPGNGVYYGISDDRSPNARFYTVLVDLSDGNLANGDVTFTSQTVLKDGAGLPFVNNTVDPEGIAIAPDGNLLIGSEGVFATASNPFVNKFNLATGQQMDSLAVPAKFLPDVFGAGQTKGVRGNLAFESLTTSEGLFAFTATESAMVQDGPVATLAEGSPARILKYDLSTGQPAGEFLYVTDPIPTSSNPPGGFADNGLVELLALDGNTLLAMERSFAAGVGNNIRIYEISLTDATDISGRDSLLEPGIPPLPVAKRLILDLGDLGIPLDNVEGMTFGPLLPDGRRSLILVSDNNFSATQFTQFLAFAINPVPEPASAVLLLGGLGLLIRRRVGV